MDFTKEEANFSDSIKYQVAHIYLGKCHIYVAKQDKTRIHAYYLSMCFAREMPISYMLCSPKWHKALQGTSLI